MNTEDKIIQKKVENNVDNKAQDDNSLQVDINVFDKSVFIDYLDDSRKYLCDIKEINNIDIQEYDSDIQDKLTKLQETVSRCRVNTDYNQIMWKVQIKDNKLYVPLNCSLMDDVYLMDDDKLISELDIESFETSDIYNLYTDSLSEDDPDIYVGERLGSSDKLKKIHKETRKDCTFIDEMIYEFNRTKFIKKYRYARVRCDDLTRYTTTILLVIMILSGFISVMTLSLGLMLSFIVYTFLTFALAIKPSFYAYLLLIYKRLIRTPDLLRSIYHYYHDHDIYNFEKI